MNDEFLGRPLVDLPKSHEIFIGIELEPAEKVLYTAILNGFKEFLNADLKDGDKNKNMKLMMVWLTRLRL